MPSRAAGQSRLWRVARVETAARWSGSKAWRRPSRRPMPATAVTDGAIMVTKVAAIRIKASGVGIEGIMKTMTAWRPATFTGAALSNPATGAHGRRSDDTATQSDVGGGGGAGRCGPRGQRGRPGLRAAVPDPRGPDPQPRPAHGGRGPRGRHHPGDLRSGVGEVGDVPGRGGVRHVAAPVGGERDPGAAAGDRDAPRPLRGGR